MIYEKLKYYAESKPNHIAIVDSIGETTYLEIFEKSIGLMHWFAKNNIKSGSRIVVAAARGRETAFALYATLFCGATYIPLESTIPLDRKLKILSKTNPDVVIINQEEYGEVSSAGFLALTVVAEKLEEMVNLTVNKAAQWGLNNPSTANMENDYPDSLLAYIIFTSGSTGEQKGVCIKRHSIFNFIKKYCVAMGYENGIRMLGVTSLSGDGSMIQHLCTHYMGGTLYTHNYKLPSELIRFIEKSKITDIDCSATIVKIMTSKVSGISNANLSDLKRVSYGGDNLPLRYIKELKKYVPNVDIYNGYGPTECTVLSSLYKVENTLLQKCDDTPVPIGRPFDGVEFLLADTNNDEHSSVIEGELLIGGEQVMAGYLNDTELTSNVTVIINNKKYYRTGDVVAFYENGLYVFKRRKNEMIKIRGYRIFPSEIENEIRNYAGVKDCYIVKREENGFVETLRAYIIEKDEETVNIATMIQFLIGKLPSYMIPNNICVVDNVPIKPNGKVDRQALSVMK
ncbi:MAG: AMP-binding protein [Bacteroidales bacterium]|jgi:amino acid adenylation domain-containing protein|nr:AMP-binding protein [Bacteroidales bacterium]